MAEARRRGVPWAGLAAVLLVLGLDAWVGSREALWSWLRELQSERQAGLGPGLVRDRVALVQLKRLRKASPARGRVAIVGTSRARRGLRDDVIEPLVAPGMYVQKLAHAGMQPYEILALVDELIDSHVEVVWLPLSEYDTHRPLGLDPLTGAGSPAALGELLRLGGWPLVARESTALLQLALATVLDGYRFREVWRDVGLERVTGLAALERRADQRARARRLTEDDPLTAARLARVVRRFPHISEGTCRAGLEQVTSITPGPHVAVQSGLLRAAVRRLTDAGVDVVLLEMPLAPLANSFYDVGLREEFQTVADELAEHELVTFLPRHWLGGLGDDDFVDLTHLGNEAPERISRRVAVAVRQAVARRRARRRAEG